MITDEGLRTLACIESVCLDIKVRHTRKKLTLSGELTLWQVVFQPMVSTRTGKPGKMRRLFPEVYLSNNFLYLLNSFNKTLKKILENGKKILEKSENC